MFISMICEFNYSFKIQKHDFLNLAQVFWFVVTVFVFNERRIDFQESSVFGAFNLQHEFFVLTLTNAWIQTNIFVIEIEQKQFFFLGSSLIHNH